MTMATLQPTKDKNEFFMVSGEASAGARSRAPQPPPGSVRDVRPIELLLIEDEPRYVRRTLATLADNKIRNRVQVAADGMAGLECLRRSDGLGESARPDVVLLSLRLWCEPNRSACEQLIGECDSLGIPVVLLTDGERGSREAGSGSIAAVRSLSVPLDFRQIVRLVESVPGFGFAIMRSASIAG
jgi:hypothetical protein